VGFLNDLEWYVGELSGVVGIVDSNGELRRWRRSE